MKYIILLNITHPNAYTFSLLCFMFGAHLLRINAPKLGAPHGFAVSVCVWVWLFLGFSPARIWHLAWFSRHPRHRNHTNAVYVTMHVSDNTCVSRYRVRECMKRAAGFLRRASRRSPAFRENWKQITARQ